MKEITRVRNELQEWNRLPDGYAATAVNDRVQPGDVQKISDDWYCEYPANGGLVGHLRGAGGQWYRKAPLPVTSRAVR